MKHGIKKALILVLVFVLNSLFLLYLLPLSSLEFKQKELNHNFSLYGENESMQFYPNMRFKTNEITYNISGCEFQKNKIC